jgi:sulfite dehydrogenase (quinone) subunit SoeC
VGLVGTVICFALFVCTGMIYACIKFLQEWHTPLTVINYTLLGTPPVSPWLPPSPAIQAPHLTTVVRVWAMIITLSALVTRVWSLLRNRRIQYKSSLRTAIGVPTATSCRSPRASWPAPSTPASSSTARPGRYSWPSSGPSWCWCSRCRCCCSAAGMGSSAVAVLLAAFLVQYARPDRRALVLLRPGEPPAEPVLPDTFRRATAAE